MDTNYFVCTLGQAASLGGGKSSFNNINEFLDLRAQSVGNKPAVGFFEPVNDQNAPSDVPSQPGNSSSPKPQLKRWTITFSELRNGSLLVADIINRKLGEHLNGRQTVGLLSPSSPTFVFIWLALIRLGHSVLLVAPQCQPPAIAHLLRLCSASTLFHDLSLETLAAKIAKTAETSTLSTIPLSSVIPTDLFSSLKAPIQPSTLPAHPIQQTDIAFLFHTSGTSSGLPKPIPQTHRGAACALPQALPGAGRDGAATFTTTPLYHGGIADCFRAWTAGAPAWLFPAHALPVTAANVCACLDAAALESAISSPSKGSGGDDDGGYCPPVRYFSCVPYVLQLLDADASGAGLARLRGMALVGVGGAALPADVGDRLVERGVRLVSRYGSAECGFLMSSHREYDKGDREWQYLRCGGAGGEYLRFERREDGLAELVVLKGWPHMAKSNREDGSFATADLMIPHPTIPDAWKYHSRADAQLTLITGKKFDPSPLESAMTASPLLDDVLIFGNGRPFPGALLFRSESSAVMSDEGLIDAVKSLVEKLNEESQQHARIPRNMLVPMAHDPGALEKSSKGTVMRGKAEEKYADLVESSYSKLSVGDGSKIPDEDVAGFIVGLIESVVSKPGKLGEDDDLFSYGVDSVACMQIRYGLNQLLPKSSSELPLSVVEDCGTVQRLSSFMLKLRHGESYEESEDELELMLSLVEKYVTPYCLVTMILRSRTQVLTGATGALGAHILHLYRASNQTSKIYCLARGSDAHAARERVDKALTEKRLPGLTASEHAGNSKIVVLQSQLGEANLGLTGETYARIAAETTVVMHIAWSVNFRMRLRSFEKDNIAGLHNLLALALRSPRLRPPFFAFCSSVASAANYRSSPSSRVSERPLPYSSSPTASSPLGYSRSKWVAERICQRAHEHQQRQQRANSKSRNIAVFRVGQLSGDARDGVWNAREAWPLLLSTVRVTGCLPALRGEALAWLPVDVAAAAFVEAAGSSSAAAAVAVPGEEEGGMGEGGEMKVYHVLNEHCEPDWMQLLEWLGKVEEFEVVEPRVWLERLEKVAARTDDGGSSGEREQHPALKLLGLWKDAYGEKGRSAGAGIERRTFATEETKKVAPVLRKVRPVDDEYFGKIWRWLGDVKMV
ncbi:Linear gramicidin synthase subunit D [Diplodia seriata]|uniref:Linear gramicidin synthase subunit D n=1 Tax=Diplodia seriata TaxID=420778 RepID=A0A1S8B928_9PEZI|nr:Linear gramicidin synthase subunit D [Diplodia seriata]